MKTLYTLFAAALLSCCSHDDDHTVATAPQQADLLPAATQTGANTVGCLVNGQAFVPYGNIAGGNKHLFYQDGVNFGLFLGEKKNGVIRSVGVASLNEALIVGHTYVLSEYLETSKNGEYTIGGTPPPSPKHYSTNNNFKGEPTITHHDFDHAIMSGTFWFDAVNSEGTKVAVREGRFDMQY